MFTLNDFLLEEVLFSEAFTEKEGRKIMDDFFSHKFGNENFLLEDEENYNFDFDYYNY